MCNHDIREPGPLKKTPFPIELNNQVNKNPHNTRIQHLSIS